MENPFIYGKAVYGPNFADREEEISEMMMDLKSGQNILVYSPRRYGKTSLVQEVLSNLRKEGVLTVYVDLFPVTSKSKFADFYTAALARGTETKLEAMIRVIREVIGVTPKIKIKPEGLPNIEVELGLRRPDVDQTLENIYDAPQQIAKKRKKRVAVVFDEFQEIANLDGEHIERSMRTKVQHHDQVAYVFMGSKRHILKQIFRSKARAFYKQAKEYPLGKISSDKFKGFIAKKFAASGFKIDETSILKILGFTEGHPYYTQQLCHELWNLCLPNRTVRVSDVDIAVEKVLRINSGEYARIWESLTNVQRAVLLAIATEGGQGQLYSSEFIERHDLVSPQHVQKALKPLEQKELIERNRKWEVTDIFFREWLRKGPQ